MSESAIRNPQSAIASPWPHRVAVLLVSATFPLIWVGGLVTTYDAGMAVPDWPSTYGYNLFLYPWQAWIYGPFNIFIEHGHRLLGASVGLIAIALVLVTWWCDWRNWVKALAAITLGAVIVQGVLGGLRVLENSDLLAKTHGIFGPTFFALCVTMAVVTSRLWRSAVKTAPHPQGGKLQRLAIITAGLVLLQIAVGANLRHLPVDFTPQMFRIAVFFHLLLAAALVVHIVLLFFRIVRQHRDEPALVRPGMALVALIGMQLVLGSATWVIHYAWPSWMQGFAFTANLTLSAGGYWQAMVVTAHQATGSLILGCAVMLALRSVRLVPQLPRSVLANVKLTGVLA
jgi:cytochrome c oxidase assembly protein subunit 15